MVKKKYFSETHVLFYFHKRVKKQENMKYIELNVFSLKKSLKPNYRLLI